MINTRYEIIKKLGQGRSTVYLCRDIEFPEKKLAIKILPPSISAHEQELFYKEFFTLQKLEHPSIIEAFDLGTVFHTDGESEIEPGSLYMTLEYFEGEELLASQKILDEKNLREIVKQICAVLYYIHQSKYIYYDLKPENILFSFKDGNLQIRLIDLGLAEYSPSPTDYEIKGTAYYIAPELLKKENHNYSVDFYSLGIILYQIVYGRFPYDAKSELDIFKSAIENYYDFPPSEKFSEEFISAIKKMLEKDPAQRYTSALQIIVNLGFSLDLSITKEFLPARVCSCRDEVINLISNYIKDNSSSVYSVKGFDGVGKSSLLEKVYEFSNESILISDVMGKSADELVLYVLRKIIFSKPVFPKLSADEKNILLGLLLKKQGNTIDELKSTFALLSSKNKFVLLIDDFNLFDPLTCDILVEIMPLLQVNNIKLIVAETSGHNFVSSRLSNVSSINLGSFTKEEMITFLEQSYSKDFPTEHLQKLITANADLVPGNIKLFIKDLILFGIMKFSDSGAFFSADEEKLIALTEAHYSIYDLRLSNLSKKELSTAKILSAFDIYININSLSLLLGLSREKTEQIIYSLQLNNIIQKLTSAQTLVFTSEAIKKYIYASIVNKKRIHLKIAQKLSEKIPSLNRIEEARQYELAEDFNKCFEITMEVVNEAEKNSAYAYMQRLLAHLIQLPLDNKVIDSLMIKISEVYLKLGDVQSSLKIIKEIKNRIPISELESRVFSIEGSALIAAGDYESGKKVITEILEKIDNEDEKKRLRVELAYVDFELKKYKEARDQCNILIEEKELPAELMGRCYNLLGMIDIHQSENLGSALEHFQKARQKFAEAAQPAREAAAEGNIGNVYSILREYKKAEMHWQNASEINRSIGNLEQEGLLLQSLGVFYFDRKKLEPSVQSYTRALNIFLSLGKKTRRGQVLWNLGEVFISLCEYQKAFDSFSEARTLFEQTKNYEELADVLFMLGKLYFKIGFHIKLEEAFVDYNFNYSYLEASDKYENLKEFMEQIVLYSKTGHISETKLKIINHEFLKKDDTTNLKEALTLLIQFYLNQDLFDKAIEEINKPEITNLWLQSTILEAEKEYFLGLISKNLNSEKLLSPLEHFEKAYDLIKNEYITELTWKVLFEISELYLRRGNFSKAKRYIVYTREAIYFIAEKIESPHLRAAYLRQSERFNTLKILDSYYS